MNGTAIHLVQPLAYRVWDPRQRAFFYSDVRPDNSEQLDRWTGLFDKQGLAIYEQDILRVHYDWRFGWVRALVVRHEKKQEYVARATSTDGEILQIGFYNFLEGYRIGNLRQHPGKLTQATEQFPEDQIGPWWLSSVLFPSAPGASVN